MSAIFLIYVENWAICGIETAKLTACFVSRAHSRYIWSFYRHNKNRYIKKGKGGPGPETEKYDFCLMQNTRNLQHICTRSPILIVTLHTVLENDSTVPAGWSWCWSFTSQCYNNFSRINCIVFKFEGSLPGDTICCFPLVFPCQNAERDGCASSE